MSFSLLASGTWTPSDVRTTQVPSARRIVKDVETIIESHWRAATREKGRLLFDGPMCRLESFQVTGASLHLNLSDTSYKVFLGTNLSHPHLADQYGPEVLANPVGVSVGLVTNDNWMLLGVRNGKVAYYPSRIHPFAGSLEPAEGGDVFAAAARELEEELSLKRDELRELTLVGIVADATIRQPELIFRARTSLKRSEVEARLDPAEHSAIFAIEANPQSLLRTAMDPRLTPVATAAITLWTQSI